MSGPAADLCALILAAGEGVRLDNQPKAFVSIGGRSLIERAIDLVRPIAAEIVVAVRPADLDRAAALLGDGPARVIAGGEQRQHSMTRLLAASQGSLVLFIDPVRPLVVPADVEAVIAAGRNHGAASLFEQVPIRDALALREGDMLATPLRRETAVWIQTPQAFRRDWIEAADRRAQAEGWIGSSIAFLVQRAGFAVHLVAATGPNPKITFPEDLAAAEAALKTSSPARGRAGYGRRRSS